jgi:uncharacterized protein YndB with AHSA1/START domain
MPIHVEAVFPGDPERIYELLTDGARFSMLVGRRGRGGSVEGAWFSLLGDRLEGRQIELVRFERVVQAWRFADWTPGVYSIVRFTLQPEPSGTRVVVYQDGYPADSQELLVRSWRSLYFEPMAQHLRLEEASMSTFVLAYRYPRDLQATGQDVLEAWQAFLDGLGSNLIDAGNTVFVRTTLGNCPTDTVLGGYSFISADDLQAASGLAEKCPALKVGGGVEIGELTLLNQESVRSTADDHARATRLG